MAKQTWIYLIKDNFTGYHKIGFSDDPKKRLKALCSQKTLLPMANDFVLIEAWLGHTTDERELHKMYVESNIRGEWFNLSENDLEFISLFFYEAKRLSTGTSEWEESPMGKRSIERDQRQHKTFQDAAIVDWLDFAVEAIGYEF